MPRLPCLNIHDEEFLFRTVILFFRNDADNHLDGCQCVRMTVATRLRNKHSNTCNVRYWYQSVTANNLPGRLKKLRAVHASLKS